MPPPSTGFRGVPPPEAVPCIPPPATDRTELLALLAVLEGTAADAGVAAGAGAGEGCDCVVSVEEVVVAVDDGGDRTPMTAGLG